MEEPLFRQQAFDDLVTTVLARFLSGVEAEIDDHIRASLGEISQFIGADYAFLIQVAPDQRSWSATHEWCSPGAPSHLSSHQCVPMGTLEWVEHAILAGEILAVDALDQMPAEANPVRRHWELLGFQSALHVPMRGRGGLVSGCLGLSTLRHPVSWAQTDIQRLRLLGEAIANALERKRLELELQASEARYRTTFEKAPVGIAHVGTDGKLLRANQRLCDMLGYANEELVGRHVDELTHADDRQAAARLYSEVLTHRTTRGSLEKRYIRKNGNIVWGNVTLALLAGEEGEPRAIVAVVEDVTDRKHAEETFDAVPDLILVLDRQHRIVRANRAAAGRLGCSREELLGRPCHEVVHGAEGIPQECLHLQVLGDGQPHVGEAHESRLGGDVLVSCTPMRDSRGEVTGSVHVVRDVSALKRTEEELRRAHEQLEQRRALAVAASLDGVWEWDATTDRVQYSHRFVELLGYVAGEVPERLDFFRSILHPDDAPALWQALQEHLDRGTPYDVECRLRHKAGDYRWFRTRGRAQRDATGRATWMAGSLQDIHEQRMAETGLRAALAEVERLTARLQAENVYLQEEIACGQGFDEIVGRSAPLRSTLAKVEHVAATDASVVLLGETGTGKELLARAIHRDSRRHERPLVRVNLAALPASLIESELFGHVKGAFTGAVGDKIGRFQLADGGTLFLDEIGDLDLELQTKLLRVLQEGEFERIGSSETIRADVRIVAATNRDLYLAMNKGKFRPDLFYRLAVFPIEVPPLRLRREDIPLLVWHFIAKKRVRLGKHIDQISQAAMEAMIAYDWPGNVRELENVVERAMILSPGSSLVLEGALETSRRPAADVPPDSPKQWERVEIIQTLEACAWKIKGNGNAAERLGLKPSTLRYRMKMLGIRRPKGAVEN